MYSTSPARGLLANASTTVKMRIATILSTSAPISTLFDVR